MDGFEKARAPIIRPSRVFGLRSARPASTRPPSRWRPTAESAGGALRPYPAGSLWTTESRGRAPLHRRRRSPADGHCARVAAQDAVHVALAVVNGVDYLVTWNLRHIANAVVQPGIERICRQAGFEPAAICGRVDGRLRCDRPLTRIAQRGRWIRSLRRCAECATRRRLGSATTWPRSSTTHELANDLPIESMCDTPLGGSQAGANSGRDSLAAPEHQPSDQQRRNGHAGANPIAMLVQPLRHDRRLDGS